MCELPYFCHVCSAVVYIEDKPECPRCKESFIEVYNPDDEYDRQVLVEPPQSRGQRIIQSFLGGMFGRPTQIRKERSIASDRRNYAIGPEIHDIITRMREEKQIEENPATEKQKSFLQKKLPQQEDVCSICLCEYADEEEGELYPCGHLFHTTCSDAWLKFQSECPICRKPL